MSGLQRRFLLLRTEDGHRCKCMDSCEPVCLVSVKGLQFLLPHLCSPLSSCMYVCMYVRTYARICDFHNEKRWLEFQTLSSWPHTLGSLPCGSVTAMSEGLILTTSEGSRTSKGSRLLRTTLCWWELKTQTGQVGQGPQGSNSQNALLEASRARREFCFLLSYLLPQSCM